MAYLVRVPCFCCHPSAQREDLLVGGASIYILGDTALEDELQGKLNLALG